MIHLLHGPNLNLLGQREPSLYGSRTLSDLEAEVAGYARSFGLEVVATQFNDEGQMLDYVHKLDAQSQVVINAGAWTHTSIALRDALKGVGCFYVEVHISQVHARESFRHRSFLSRSAKAYFSGFGIEGYKLAVDFLVASRVEIAA